MGVTDNYYQLNKLKQENGNIRRTSKLPGLILERKLCRFVSDRLKLSGVSDDHIQILTKEFKKMKSLKLREVYEHHEKHGALSVIENYFKKNSHTLILNNYKLKIL